MKHLLPLLLLLSFSAQAQELLHCGADEMRIQTLQANPKVAEAVVARDTELEAYTRAYESSDAQRGGGIYLIPVVFHVIHEYGTENISREQMLDGLDVLNKTFRKLREDTAEMVADFKPLHADCGIEFHLATYDPDGNCHSGINRIASDLTNTGNHQVKQLVHWDPTRYLNIYVVRNAAGLAGHAVWPSDADTIPEWDGIVISHNYVGSMGTSDPTRSVVLAHECGHYLNLHHIWGGNNVPNFYYLPVGQQANCAEDDLVQDTPNTIGWSNCNLTAASCGNSVDNVQNAMDYSYCNVMFTQGQKTRMHACLNSSIAGRNNLWSMDNLISTGVMPASEPWCGVEFRADQRVSCPDTDNQITFVAETYHGTADSLTWQFDGGSPSTSSVASPTVTYSTLGQYDVTVVAWRNGQSVSTTAENYITVLPDASETWPLATSFEGFSALDGPLWYAHSEDDLSAFGPTQLAAYTGSTSVMVDNSQSDILAIDHLYAPPLDLSAVSQMRIAFRYAYSGTTDATSKDRLLLQATRNCQTTWTTRLTLNADELQTAPSGSAAFVPTHADAWKQAVVNVPATYFEDGFRFRFVHESTAPSRLYIDDVNVDVTAGLDELPTDMASVQLYPNPAQESVNLRLESLQATQVSVQLLDVTGRTIRQYPLVKTAQGASTLTLSLHGCTAGIYLLQLRTPQGQVTQRLVVE